VIEAAMQITVDLDEKLLATAKAYTGISDTSAVINEGLRALVEREAARRLMLLGVRQPQSKRTPLRRSAKRRK
jgi:Arc/MetJ family transcription regulator